ncbi:IPT/TIG domain-containing protein [Sphingobacterium kyonggiense]
MKMNISILFRITIVLFFLGVIVNYACKKKEVLVKKLDPIFSEFYPNSGGPGTLITIEGENLEANLDAYKISIAENEAEVISVTKNKLVFMAPSKSISGEIVVKHESSAKNIGKFTYQDLTIKGISPANGSSGTVIKIMGSGFAGELDPAKVTINEKELSVVSASDTVLYAEVPKGTGTGAVEVHVNGKESKGQSFRYQEILGVKPLKGGKGTRVTISGMGFELDKQHTVVDFNGKLAEVIEVSETQMVVIAPAEVKSGQITVAYGKLKLPGPIFTVMPLPIIEKVVPLSAPENAEVTLTGNFYSTIAEENKVYFNGKIAEVIKVSERELQVRIPEGASNGDISLAVNDQKVNWPDFLVQNLGLLKISPDNGVSGEEITISGIGFSKELAQNKVFFNGILTPIKSATNSEIKLNLPADAKSGPVRVEVGRYKALGLKFMHAGSMIIAKGKNNTEFDYITQLVADSKGNVFVVDKTVIKKVNSDGRIESFVGGSNVPGADGFGSQSNFRSINGIAIDDKDVLFVSDGSGKSIRKVTPNGLVSTFKSLEFEPDEMKNDLNGNILLKSKEGIAYFMDSKSGNVSQVKGLENYKIRKFMIVNKNEIYFNDNSNSSIIKKMSNEKIIDYAGGPEDGVKDGPVNESGISYLSALSYNIKLNNIILLDGLMGSRIRMIEDGILTTLNPYGLGADVGNLKKTTFFWVQDMCYDRYGNIYISDSANKAIYKIYFK